MLVLFLVAAACTGGEGKPRPTLHPRPRVGGQAVFGAEQWPECINPITICAAAAWAHYTVLQHVLPRAMELDPKGNFVASPLLADAPTLENGGLTGNPFTVRYHIALTALWDDDTRITSADFDFTWRAILSTEGKPYGPAYRRDEYRHVIGVDHRDPEVAVIRFDGIYRDWPDLFGGQADYIIKASAFPNVDQRRPNLERAMPSSFATIGTSGVEPFSIR
ncbi:MAG: hypothetical protein E6G44_02250 [Actinobacteria bacterium]|nr:MAG: hypothetical protein E6G44_02250 [Actinomycetota bacterium]